MPKYKSFCIAETALVDLHTHSVANDGRWQTSTLAAAAKAAGLRVVALTDHDTTAGVAEFAGAAAAAGIYAIPGVEVSCWWRGQIFHVLLYGIDVANPTLRRLLADIWQEVKSVAARARDRLQARGYPLPQLQEARRAGGDLLPVDVMVAALRSGLAADFQDVVRILVEEMGIDFRAGADMAAAVAAGHAAGGVAILAHPGRLEYGFSRVEPGEIVEMVEAADLDGLEVYHWSHGEAENDLYGRLAAERGLLVSCGSDSHGPRSRRGLHGYEARLCRGLLARCGVEVGELRQGGQGAGR